MQNILESTSKPSSVRVLFSRFFLAASILFPVALEGHQQDALIGCTSGIDEFRNVRVADRYTEICVPGTLNSEAINHVPPCRFFGPSLEPSWNQITGMDTLRTEDYFRLRPRVVIA